MTQIRFAPIIRVSTEGQEKKSESLKTQRTQIIGYVKALKGIIPEHCWQYCGQESATKKERILWDKLLEDSGKDIFDAIIVCDASRWSRNNQKSLEGLEILRKNKIRFFIATSEKDLNLPSDKMTIGLFTTMNQYIAEEQVIKSQQNRVHRAKRGVPTAGKLPYGRIWNKKEQRWEIDPVKKDIIEQTAKRYLAGESIRDIAKSFHVDASTLFKSLTKRCGDTWECQYKDMITGKYETVIIPIPRLLDQSLIDEVNARMDENITYVRGHRKHIYLLQGMIYCKRCGFKMSSFHNNRKTRYYRHSNYSKDCDFHKFIRADDIENAVLLNLIKTFGDPELIQKAIEQANPDTSKQEELKGEHEKLQNELRKIPPQRMKLLEKIASELITDDEAEPLLQKFRESETSIKTRIGKIEDELADLPDPVKVRQLSKFAVKMTAHITQNNPTIIFKRSYAWKRNLIIKAFNGTNHNKSKYGVFIDYDDKITYEIRGVFNSTMGALPMTDLEIAEAFHVDIDSKKFSDIKKAWHTVLT